MVQRREHGSWYNDEGKLLGWETEGGEFALHTRSFELKREEAIELAATLLEWAHRTSRPVPLADRVREAAHSRAGLSAIADGLNDSPAGAEVIWFVDSNGQLDFHLQQEPDPTTPLEYDPNPNS